MNSGPNALDPVELSPELRQLYRLRVYIHTDDPATGKCPLCHRRDCDELRWARTNLIAAGLWAGAQRQPDAQGGRRSENTGSGLP